jgi:hypothetical protein
MSLFRKFQLSEFNKLKVWSWAGITRIDHPEPFEITVIAESVDEARQEVLKMLEEIAVLKKVPKWTNDYETESYSTNHCRDFSKLEATTNASFFSCNDKSPVYFYANCRVFVRESYPKHKLDDDHAISLVDFITYTDPVCRGCIFQVSFANGRAPYD